MEELMNNSQQIFLVFFAIFWGTSANAWPKWKPFLWTFFCVSSRVSLRVLWSTLMLNVVPIVYFTCMLRHLKGEVYGDPMLAGVIPAFAIFGFYRFWIGIMEIRPALFYYKDNNEMRRLKKSRLVNAEPTMKELHFANVRWRWWRNVFFGLLYVVVATYPVWLYQLTV